MTPFSRLSVVAERWRVGLVREEHNRRNFHSVRQYHPAKQKANTSWLVRQLERHVKLAPQSRVLQLGPGPLAQGHYWPEVKGSCILLEPLAIPFRREFSDLHAVVRQTPYIAGVGEAIPLVDASVDVVLNDNVLEHVQDAARIVAEIARVLRPGGVVISMVYTYGLVARAVRSIAETIYDATGWQGCLFDPPHPLTFGPGDQARLLIAHGLMPVDHWGDTWAEARARHRRGRVRERLVRAYGPFTMVVDYQIARKV